MVQFFQMVFLIAAIVLIVLNVLEFNKWQETQKEAADKRHSIKWFNFILTSLVALGLALNIIIQWLTK
jgi:predicted negative regulator of RcsB-dependent stress response